MKSDQIHHTRRSLFTALVLACSFGANAALAGPLYVFLVVDPATTAGAGVASSNDFSVTSTRSGVGTWHLYAVDDLPDSFGIRSFNIKLNPGQEGTIPIMCNRSPNTRWDDDPTFGSGSGTVAAGFSDIRSGRNVTWISGGQGVVNNTNIGGLGISAGNFQLQTPGQSFSTTTSGQWGTYADPFTSGELGNTGRMRNALFLGEGTYTGGAPTVDLTTSLGGGGTGFNYWSTAGLTRSTLALQLSSSNPFACSECVNGYDPFFVDRATPPEPLPSATMPLPPPPPPRPIATVLPPDPPPVTTVPPEDQPVAGLPPDTSVAPPPNDPDPISFPNQSNPEGWAVIPDEPFRTWTSIDWFVNAGGLAIDPSFQTLLYDGEPQLYGLQSTIATAFVPPPSHGDFVNSGFRHSAPASSLVFANFNALGAEAIDSASFESSVAAPEPPALTLIALATIGVSAIVRRQRG